MHYYEAAPTKIVRQDSVVLTYHSHETLPVGSLVIIPVGKKTMPAVIIRSVAKPAYATKPIEQLLELDSLPAPLLRTALWMSEFYGAHLAVVLQTMLPSGLQKKRRTQKQTTLKRAERARTNFVLNTEQQAALDVINRADEKTVLLHGITGGGKTAIYIEYARQLTQQQKSVIVLTPEIALTPQLTAEFEQHFENVIISHSRLTEAERHTQWQRVLESKEPFIIIGPRSALFLPVRKLGAVIIDESHEPSYKQEQQPRYQTSRVARVLATNHNARLILGSATPSLTDYYLASRYGHIATISHRAKSNERPQITVIDATRREWFGRNPLFSTELIEKIAASLTTKRQVLLFHNRRGTASSTLCEKCGWHAACASCLLPLTLHADQSVLQCHICGHRDKIPPHCPQCGRADIIFKGVGTKRLEQEVKKLFPRARVKRFDADSEKGEALHEQYQAVYDGDVDIIIGTQLIAKGLDLPRLGLVGIPQADAGLMLPDYGARERTFQLISQAAGRVGRQLHATDVIVQTYYPDDPTIKAAVHENYLAFYEAELADRRRGKYPPFTHLLKATCAYKTEAAAVRASRDLARTLRAARKDITVIGPTPAFYERLRGLYRWQITVKSSSRQALQDVAAIIPKNWQTELDPHSLLS